MKRLSLWISKTALADLDHIWLYIAQDDVEAADRFIEEIHQKCRGLAESPEIGRRRDELAEGVRSFPVGNYVIFYRPRGERVEVVRVLSGYRDIDALFEE